MKKVRYELDPYNRLVVNLPAFRQVIDGRFKVGPDNELAYHVKSPLSQGENIPHQIGLKGSWSLTPDHRLRFTLDKSGRRTFGDKLDFHADIIGADSGAVLFGITTITKDLVRSTYVLRLEGSWKADRRNRLTFSVKREKNASDILTFCAKWEVDKSNSIIYKYESSRLLKKIGRVHSLTLNGYWDMNRPGRISYVMNADTASGFEFNASIARLAAGYIKCAVGAGISGRLSPSLRTIKLTGQWGFRKGSGIVFEIGYEDGRTHAIIFSADVKLSSKNTVSLRLRSRPDGSDLGASVELARDVFDGEGQMFLRALASRKESSLCIGAAWPW
jgi:hypothetical protein